jgi:hypothetical protein
MPGPDETKPAAEAPEQKPDAPTAASERTLDDYQVYGAKLALAHEQRVDMAPAPPGTTLH